MGTVPTSRTTRLISNVSVYAVGSFSSQLVGFITLPLLTRSLSTSEFGSIDILITLLALGVPLVSLGIAEAVLRFGMESIYEPQRVLRRGLAIGFAGFLVSLALWPPLAGINGIGENASMFFAILAVSVVREIAFQFLRSQNVVKPLLVGGVIQAVLLAVGVVVFVVAWGYGIWGYLLALFVSTALVGLTYLVLCFRLRYRASSVSSVGPSHLTSKMLRYSIPLMPNGVLWWAVASGSKLVLLGVSSAAAVGLYAVASRIVSTLTVATQVALQGWQVSAIQEQHSTTRERFSGEIFAAMTGTLVLGATLLLAVVKPVTRLLGGEAYYMAWQTVAPLLIGLIFLSMATFVGAEYRVQMTTAGALRSSIWGAAAALSLSFPLAWALGAPGAALAVSAGYLAMLVDRLRDFGLPSPGGSYPRNLALSLLVLVTQGVLQHLRGPVWLEVLIPMSAFTILIWLNYGFVAPTFHKAYDSLRWALRRREGHIPPEE